MQIYAGKDGVVWEGTSDGLEIFDPATGGFAVLHHHAADQQSLSENEILSIAEDRYGSLWFGTKGGGLSRFSTASLKFGGWRRNPADLGSLSDANVRAIYRDRSGVLWIGTYDGGLNRYEPGSGTFTHIRHDARSPASLDSDRVYSIYEDNAGAVWIGTGAGINRLNRSSGTFTRFKRGPLDGNGGISPTYSLVEDRRGGFWFGTSGGRAALDAQTGAVTSISNRPAISMHEDRKGNLWFGGPGGLTRKDSSGNIRTIAPRDLALKSTTYTRIRMDCSGLPPRRVSSDSIRKPKPTRITRHRTVCPTTWFNVSSAISPAIFG